MRPPWLLTTSPGAPTIRDTRRTSTSARSVVPNSSRHAPPDFMRPVQSALVGRHGRSATFAHLELCTCAAKDGTGRRLPPTPSRLERPYPRMQSPSPIRIRISGAATCVVCSTSPHWKRAMLSFEHGEYRRRASHGGTHRPRVCRRHPRTLEPDLCCARKVKPIGAIES